VYDQTDPQNPKDVVLHSGDKVPDFVDAGTAQTLVILGAVKVEPDVEEELAPVVVVPTPEPAPLFDPSEYSMPEVFQYLEDKDEAEIKRVVDLEAQGQARKGIADRFAQ